ncbi:MAG: alpha/beta hydrolase family protein [Jatrophihabitantaceae bacterium]
MCDPGRDSQAAAELPVIAETGTARLAGSVWLPATVPPCGVVLMHPGSGPSDRDNDELFPPIRAALLATGVAVCSYDKRGVGGSSGRWQDAGIDRQADDLVHGLRAARRIVPGGPVGLFGHSQGGWVVLEASRRVGPSFVVTNSGPSLSPFLQEEYSTGNRLCEAGWSDARVAAGMTLVHELMDRALVGMSFPQAQRWMTEPERADAIRGLAHAGAFVPDSEALWSLAGSLFGHDPRPALEDMSVPLLALLGAVDSVVPVAACVARLRRRVRPDLLEVAVVAGGDHRLQVGGPETFAPGYLPVLTAFVAAQLRRFGRSAL